METKKESLDRSLEFIKETTTNEALKKMIDVIEGSTDSKISDKQLKKLSHYTFQDYVKKK